MKTYGKRQNLDAFREDVRQKLGSKEQSERKCVN